MIISNYCLLRLPQTINIIFQYSSAKVVLVWKLELQPFPLASVFFIPLGYELLVPVMPNKQSVVVPKNRLLNAFDDESRARVDPHLERINFMLGDVILRVRCSPSTSCLSPFLPE
jgi:hypothetical protein